MSETSAAAGNDLVERARALAPLIREHADEAERDRRLPKAVVDAMAAEGLFRVAAPRAVGGLETDPFTQVRVIEAVSEADGSTGWNLMIGIESTGFIGAALPADVASEIFADPALVVSGALNPLGRAVPVAGGYRVTGQWPFASGCQNSQYFWGQCIVHESDERARDANGRVVLVEIVVPAKDYEVVDTWHVSGLRGSGSHDVAVRDVFVPERLTTALGTRGLLAQGPLFRMPVFSRLAYNKVGVATGIARAAIDHFVRLASEKTPRGSRNLLRERATAQLALAEAETQLRSARAWVFEILAEVWEVVLAGGFVSDKQRALLQLACTNAASASVRAVDLVHSAAGSSANFTSNPLERCMRDVRVVPQHIMVSPQWAEAGGRVLLGLESRSLLL
ncbi:MAG: acyl-CoA dehydrogenase family protein [Myxococcota bacterium]